MKFIDDRILQAFEDAKLVFITNEKLGDYLGLSQKHIGQILAGKVQFMKALTWESVQPKLEKYIKEEVEMIPAPKENRRRYIAERLDQLDDELIDKLIVEIVKSGVS